MSVERQILVSLLRLTRQGPFRKELLSKNSRVPVQITDETLEKLCQKGFCQQRHGAVEASSIQRVRVALRAIQLGADFERVCNFLRWKEFENLAGEAFEANSYSVTRNFHFRHKGKRWEIDLLASKEPLIICVDCKHWHHGWSRSAIVKTVDMQTKRARALADAFPVIYVKIGLETWKQAIFIPAVLSLTPGSLKFHNEVPIIPILQIRNFLYELPAHASSLTHFWLETKSGKHRLTRYLQ